MRWLVCFWLLLIPSVGLADLNQHIETEEWRRADKVWKKEVMKLGKSDPTEGESAKLAELLVMRALIAAGDGDNRRADWYWWVGGLFEGRPGVEEMVDRHGPLGAKLASMIRTPPPKLKPDHKPGRSRLTATRTKDEPAGMVGFSGRLFKVACKGEVGFVTFQVQTDGKGYPQAPRPWPPEPLTARPLCSFAAIEGFRDLRQPGAEGSSIVISRTIETLRQ